MFTVMHQNTKQNSLYVKTYLGINLILLILKISNVLPVFQIISEKTDKVV